MGWGIWVSAAIAATGIAMSSVGAAEQHKQAKSNAEMQAEQAEYNKRLEEREAARVEAETAENARRQREQAEALKARQRALLGKSGAALASGSPLAILGQTAIDEEQKIRDVQRAGYIQAGKHTQQANLFGYEARVARASAPSDSSAFWNITGNAVSSIGNFGLSAASVASKKTGSSNSPSTNAE